MVNNILIIGITGNGKSALANLLADTDKFKESNSSTSATTDFKKSEPFEWEKDGKKSEYSVIDNIGFGDNRDITEEEILLKIGEGIHAAKEGINQILFVFDGRFSDDHIQAFNLFKKLISESRITDYTTLIRTKFPNFEHEEECKKDKETLLKQKRELVEIINSCKGGIIYVDNPSIPKREEENSEVSESEESDEEIKEMKKKLKEGEKGGIGRNEAKKKNSRKIVLDHLMEKCQDIYKLEEVGNVNKISSIVKDYIEKKEKIEKDESLGKDEKERLQKELESKAAKNIKENLETKLSTELDKAAAVMEYFTQKKI